MSTQFGDYIRKNKTKAAIAVTAIHVGFVVLLLSASEKSYLENFSDEPFRAIREMVGFLLIYFSFLHYIYRSGKNQDTTIYCKGESLEKILRVLMSQGFSIKSTDAAHYTCLKRRNLLQKHSVSIMIDGDVIMVEGMERFLDPLMQFRLKYIGSPHLRKVV